MRKLINIWKISWSSHWMQRAIHILSQVKKWFPKEGSKECWHGWRAGTGTVPRLPELPALGVQQAELRCRSQFAFSQLHFVFCLSVVLNNQAQRGGMDRPLCAWYKWSCAGNFSLGSVGRREGGHSAHPSRHPQTGKGCGSAPGQGSPSGGLRGTWWNSTRTSAKCCPFQGQPQQLLPRNHSSVTAALMNTGATDTAPACTNSILTPEQKGF